MLFLLVAAIGLAIVNFTFVFSHVDEKAGLLEVLFSASSLAVFFTTFGLSGFVFSAVNQPMNIVLLLSALISVFASLVFSKYYLVLFKKSK